jgi:hypothetical protein
MRKYISQVVQEQDSVKGKGVKGVTFPPLSALLFALLLALFSALFSALADDIHVFISEAEPLIQGTGS